MSSAIQSPQPSLSKQWWNSKPSSSRIPSSTYRPGKSPVSAPTTPVPTVDEKGLRTLSKGSKKFNTLASVIGFKTKKSHPSINIPAGPVSPPLPFQNPPPPQQMRSPRLRTTTLVSPMSSNDPMSPGEPSIYTLPSSDEAFEAITPSDQVSRHRISNQPSLFTFAEQQDHNMPGRLGDNLRYQYDAHRISVMSDPSIIDPHMPRGHFSPSRISDSSYLIPDHKSVHGSILIGLSPHRESYEGLDMSRHINADLDEISSRRESSDSRKHRYSDTGLPDIPKEYAALLPSNYGAPLRKYPSATATVPSGTLLKTKPRSDSLSPSISDISVRSQHTGRERVGSFRSMRSNGTHVEGVTSLAFPRAVPSVRPKAVSVSAGSYNSSAKGREAGHMRPQPSINTSIPRNPSITSGMTSMTGSTSGSLSRQASSTRLRAVPPSRNPPPRAELPLPPTPNSQPPSPLTFSENRNASSSSLLNSAYDSLIGGDPSLLAFRPPSPPSSDSASSISLCFAHPGQTSLPNSPDENIPPSRSRRFEMRDYPWSPGDSVRSHKSINRPATQPRHENKSSVSSNNTLMNTFGIRSDAQSQRLLKRSTSQQSISANIAMNIAARGDRPRVDSGASGGSTAILSEEGGSSSSKFGSIGSMGRLRKQKSLHNTRATGGSLALPPLPQQLRHASSFNAPGEGSNASHSSFAKSESTRRSPHSSASVSAATSIVTSPTTPQTHKKRSLFSSHGRDRRDSNAARDKAETQHAETGEKKNKHGGLGLFTGHFSPSGTFANASSSRTSLQDSSRDAHRMSLPAASTPPPQSPTSNNLLDQHILPPKELLSQMEALADIEEPSSPPQFSLKDLGSEGEDEWSWDGRSMSTNGQDGVRSRVSSIGARSTSFEWSEESSIPPSTRLFASATGSIHSRLQNERPSTASRLPARTGLGLGIGKSMATGNGRPSTAEPISPARSAFESSEIITPVALPPPPRRKGTVISAPVTDNDSDSLCYKPPTPLSPPPSTHFSARGVQRNRSVSNGNVGLQHYSSMETISANSYAYNPNRGSIFRKPSFLDISDGFTESMSNNRCSMASVPEDSFLILERGKDSLEIGRLSEEYLD